MTAATNYTTLCICGQPATVRLFVHYRYPRTEYLPEAVDPYYVHGGGCSLEVCGSLCEADALLACREQIIDSHASWMPSGFTDEQVAGLELAVYVKPEDGMRVLDDDEDAA